MAEKTGKMKFKISGKTTAEDKARVKIDFDCSGAFLVSAIAKMLVSEKGKPMLNAMEKAVHLARICSNLSNPSQGIDMMLKAENDLLRGYCGDVESGMRGLDTILSIIDSIPEVNTKE